MVLIRIETNRRPTLTLTLTNRPSRTPRTTLRSRSTTRTKSTRTSSRRAWRRSSKPNPNPDPNPNPNPNPNPSPNPDPNPNQVIKTFRQRGTGGDALFVKIDHGKDELQLEDNLHGTTVDAARWKAPALLAMRQRTTLASWG